MNSPNRLHVLHLLGLKAASVVLSVLALTGCSPHDQAISIDGARKVAPNLPTRPLPLDPSGALKPAGVGTAVTQDSVTASEPDPQRTHSFQPGNC